MRLWLNWIERLTTDQESEGSTPSKRAILFFNNNLKIKNYYFLNFKYNVLFKLMNNFYSQEKVFFQKAKKNIEKYTNIVILGHINPDGDCIGSQTALYYAIKAKYPNKKIYFPFAETEYSKFLLPQNYQNEINPTIFKNSLVIVVDFHEKKRLNNLKIPKDNFVIVIDHHPEISRDLGDLV